MTSEEIPAFGQTESESRRNTKINSVSYRVIKRVAEESNKSISELESLYYSIDPDALESLFSNPPNRTADQLTFMFSGYRITVNGEGSTSTPSIVICWI
ncbi:HalOD1 output domain-containing protein [Natrinema gelatinilyticum]|uniref:HalOD1 output domain-containing protein n=1 Tax=Natrinema gelatinilyticum TaxID=2961571 RepID=UPI003CE58A46